MFSRFSSHQFALGFLSLFALLLAACSPAIPIPQTGQGPSQAGSEIVLQLTYEPGFVLPEYRFPFGRTPYFTLLADGRAVYVDESQDFKVVQAQLSGDEAGALVKQVFDLGFERLVSHTDMCGQMADGSEACIADASTNVLRVQMENDSLREVRSYAGFSNEPAAYEAIYTLLTEYTHPQSEVYIPHAATLFVRIVPAPEMSSPADWPLDPAYVDRARSAPDQLTAVVLGAKEAALWQKNVGVNSGPITFQLEGQPVSGYFVPWLPGEDFSAAVEAEFPSR